MKKIIENFKEIFETHKGLTTAMGILVVISLALLIFSLLNLGSSATVIKTSYGDIGRYQGGEWTSMANSGGYHDGVWIERLAYPILALIFGVLHNLLAVKLYEKKGTSLAFLFVCLSIALVLSVFVVFGRLLGEG